MNYFRSLLLLSLLFAACKNNSTATDIEGRIPAKTLEKILYDMQIADVYSLSVRADSTKSFGQKNPDSLARYYKEIFAHNGVTYDQFRKTIDWYKEHPPEFDTVYQNVLNRISAEEERRNNNKGPQ